MKTMTTEEVYSNSKNTALIGRLENGVYDYETLDSLVELSKNMLDDATKFEVEEELIRIANEKEILALVSGEHVGGLYEWQRKAFAKYLKEATQIVDEAIQRASR
jgi:hypothetical protein